MSEEQGLPVGRARGRSRGRARTAEELRDMLAARRPGEAVADSSLGRGRGVATDKPAPAIGGGRAYNPT